jgi:hypothetical protein
MELSIKLQEVQDLVYFLAVFFFFYCWRNFIN